MIIPSVGVLLFIVGILIGKAKRNFFIGIRTPWTLSSDEVWNRTNRVGGTLFKIAAVVIILLSLVPAIAIYTMVGLLVPLSIGLVIYSYVLYHRLGQPPQPPVGQ
jgi:uncharacterized membrane protein